MNRAYLRHKPSTEGDKFDISFQLVDPEFKVDRNFNFTRSLDENVSTFLSRITTNVEKAYAKKNKRKKKSPDAVEDQTPAVSVSLYCNLIKINEEVPCNQVFKEKNSVTLKLFDKEYEVVINAPFIESITLPSSILPNFPVYPLKFEALYYDEKYSVFAWYKSHDKKEWEQIGTEYICTPGDDAIGCYLKMVCIPRNEHHEGPKIEVISDGVVSPTPGVFPFERRHEFTKSRSKTKE